jgi:hypothetical protein
MKNIFLFFIIMFCAGALHAQPPRRDTAWASASAELMDAPILEPTAVAMTIVPNRQQFCFNTMIEVEMHYGSATVEQGLFMNTTDGYIGFTAATVGGGGAINMILPEIPDFNFMVFGFKGNAYRYFNRKNKQGIQEHWVSTGNTDMHKYQISDVLTSAPLARKNMYRSFCSGSARAMAYKVGDQSTVWYLYGDHYPENLHAVKFFGGFGVGVLKTREGNFVVMQMETGNNSSTIKLIEKMRQCFDPAGYKLEESEFMTSRRLELDRERDKIERNAISAQNARTCQSERMAIVNFNREELRRQEQNLENTTHGNTYQDLTTQKAYVGMMDPLITVKFGILEAGLNICEANEALSRGSSESAQRKLVCSSDRLGRLRALQPQMEALDRQYDTQPGMAMAKKSQLLLAEMRNNCN